MLILRPAKLAELPEVSALMMRSKALWGYDNAFMAACRDELTLTPSDLDTSEICLACQGDQIIGIAQILPIEQGADLTSLFVDPAHKGTGAGRTLFEWALARAKKICNPNLEKPKMIIDADPFAVPFYQHMGAYLIGEIPSTAIPGRFLPQLACDLDEQT